MHKVILLFVMMGVVVAFLGCETIQTGGGRVQSCGIDMKYCSPGP